MPGSTRHKNSIEVNSLSWRIVDAPEAVDAHGIVLLAADGQEQLRVGLIEGEPSLETNLFVGMNWAFAPDASVLWHPRVAGAGRRILLVYGPSSSMHTVLQGAGQSDMRAKSSTLPRSGCRSLQGLQCACSSCM
jgi:hypothetical protein